MVVVVVVVVVVIIYYIYIYDYGKICDITYRTTERIFSRQTFLERL